MIMFRSRVSRGDSMRHKDLQARSSLQGSLQVRYTGSCQHLSDLAGAGGQVASSRRKKRRDCRSGEPGQEQLSRQNSNRPRDSR